MLRNFLKFFTRPDHASAANGRCILVVEDGEGERRVISTTLDKRGYAVTAVETGEAGLEAAGRQKFDLILLDYKLPGINGKEVCRRLKADTRTKDIPVIFLTGSMAPGDIIDCYDVGAEYYLSKPISAKMLIKQVDMIFSEIAAFVR